jgi:hypothetical protein
MAGQEDVLLEPEARENRGSRRHPFSSIESSNQDGHDGPWIERWGRTSLTFPILKEVEQGVPVGPGGSMAN